MTDSTATTMAPCPAAAPRGRWWIFPAIVVGLLVMQVGLCAAGFIVANRSQSFVVESDYYTKALHWDDDQAAKRASDALGWKTTIGLAPALDEQGNRQVVISVADRDGHPVTGATVEVLFFHHARGKETQKATLRELGAGNYMGRLPMARPGRWEVRTSIVHGVDRFFETFPPEFCN